jgi:hypothetical protein
MVIYGHFSSIPTPSWLEVSSQANARVSGGSMQSKNHTPICDLSQMVQPTLF